MRKTVQVTLALGLTLPAMAVLAQGPVLGGGGSPNATAGGTLSSDTSSQDAAAAEPPASTVEAATETRELPVEGAESADVESAAAAEESEAPAKAEPAARSSSRLVEEIIVTAQKREEKLSVVPLSVQAYSPEALEARGVANTADLQKITTSLDYGTQAGSFTTIYLRGVGTEAFLTSDPSVATYVDGVYYPFGPATAQDLGGTERVEVLKGPQGTLFGRNANGGAINVIIKEPQFDERSITASQYVGSFDTYKTQIFANIPVTDTFAANVAGFFEQDATIYRDSSSIAGRPVPKNKTGSARVKLRWLPVESLDLRASLTATKTDGTATFAANIAPTTLGIAAFSTLDYDVAKEARNRTIRTDLPIYGHQEALVSTLTAIYNAEYFDTKWINSYQYESNPYNYDYDGSEFPGASFVVHRHFAKIQESEIQFLSNEGTPFSDWLTLTAGAFYFRNIQGFDPVEVTVGGLDPTNLGASFGGLGDALQSLAAPITVVGDQGQNVVLPGFLSNFATPAYSLSNIGLVLTESWSTFIQGTAKLTDNLSLTLGGRYQNERRGVLESNTSICTPPTIPDNSPASNGNETCFQTFDWKFARDGNNRPVPLSDRTKGFKPKVAVDYLFDNGTLLYASYQEAVKAHSYNAFAFYLRPAYIPEEELEAYEIGIKTALFENTTRLTAAVWNYDITNLQTQAISLLNGGALSISTAGNARTRGIEFDLVSELFPSVLSGTVVTGGFAYTDATYTKYVNGQGHTSPEDNPLVFGVFLPNGQDYTGNRIPRAAKYTATAALSQTIQVPGGPLEGTLSGYYNSGFFYEASENPLFSQPRYFTLGAHVSYLYEPAKIRVTLSGQNLTNKFYTAGELLLDFGALASIAPPVTVGLRVDWSF